MSAIRRRPQIVSFFAALRPALPGLVALSAVINVLALTGSIYMLQVYDRVLTSRSVPTLVALSLLILGIYVVQALLEIVRTQILTRLGSRMDKLFIQAAHDAATRLPLNGRTAGGALQPIRDVDTLRAFMSGPGPVAIFDMPWMPIYLAFVFFLHPLLGLVTVAGALVLLAITIATELQVREHAEVAGDMARQRFAFAEASERSSEAIAAMGFAGRMWQRFASVNSRHLVAQERLGDIVGGSTTVTRVFRLILQSALLGLGAYLTIQGSMTAGAIIACSIVASRALAPIEVTIGQWRTMMGVRQAVARLNKAFSSLGQDQEHLALPAPTQKLTVEGVTVVVPGTQRVVLSAIDLAIEAGEIVAIIGPSASGKSTLARVLTSTWRPARGCVRLDNAALENWSAEALGSHVGYLPQDVLLLDGTITENISRFEETPDVFHVIQAAKAAGVHEMILRLTDGYESRIGAQGAALSAGQRQRLALARALYKEPFLVVLDEPNSNLDADGDAALLAALETVRRRGGIAIVIAHRQGVLQACDKIAVLNNGQLAAFGPREEIIRKLFKPPVPARPFAVPTASGV